MVDNRIRQIVMEEVTKSEVEKITKDEIERALKDSAFKKKVREITADVFEDFVRLLWQRSSNWKGSLK